MKKFHHIKVFVKVDGNSFSQEFEIEDKELGAYMELHQKETIRTLDLPDSLYRRLEDHYDSWEDNSINFYYVDEILEIQVHHVQTVEYEA